jgi:hypothetical protein
VPNLDELLKPAKCAEGAPPDTCRVTKFCVATEPKFDPVRVGLPSSQGLTQCPDGEFLFDTSLRGNSNAGHEYGVFTPEERRELIEYQKSL